MDRFTIQVEFNGQVRPFLFDYSATLGEVEAMVANGCGIALLPGSQTVLSLRSGEAIAGLPSSLFLGLSSNLRLELDNPANNKSAILILKHSPPLGSETIAVSAGGMSSIDEVLALAAQTGDVSLPSGDEFLNSFDNLLGDMNKVITESTAAAQAQAEAAAATPTSGPTTSNAAFLAEFDDLELQQTANKKKTLRSRDLNAFLEAEFAGIAGIGEPKPSSEATPSTEPTIVVPAQDPQQPQQAAPAQQQNLQSGSGTPYAGTVPGLAIPTSSTGSPGTTPRPDDGTEEALILSVSQRAEMARGLAQAKKSGLEAQQVKVTAMGDKKDKKDKKEKKVKEKKEKKGKKKGGDSRETMADEFEAVANPTYVSTDRAGVNPLFKDTAGTTPQTSMEHGGFVSPLASASSTPRGNTSQVVVPGSPRGAAVLSPRSGPGTSSPTSPRPAGVPSSTATSSAQPGTTSPQATRPTAQPQSPSGIPPSSSFTKSRPGATGRALRREHTVNGGVAIGTRQSVMFSQGEVAAALQAASEAPAILTTVSSSNMPSSLSSVHDDASSSPAVTTTTPATESSNALTPTANPAAVAVVDDAPAATPTTVITTPSISAPAEVAAPVSNPTPETNLNNSSPATTEPSDNERLLQSGQQELLAAQRALEEERARIERANAERYAALMEQQKALEEQRAALLAAQQNAAAARQAAADEQNRLLAEQQKILAAEQQAQRERLEAEAAAAKAKEDADAQARATAAAVAAEQQAQEEAKSRELAAAKASEEELQRQQAEQARLLAEQQQQALQQQAAELAKIQAEQQAAQLRLEEQQRALIAQQQQEALLAQQQAAAVAAAAATTASASAPPPAATAPPMTPTSGPQVPTFVSHAPAQNYPDPTSISAMLHEQLDQLLMESPGAPATAASAPQPAVPAPTVAAPPATAAPTGPAAPTKDETSIADDMDQLLAELDRPYMPGGAAASSSGSSETKQTPDPVPDLREPGPKPAEPPPSESLNLTSISNATSTASPSSTAQTNADGTSKAPTVRRKKKKRRAPRKSDETPTGTFSAVRKSERERKKKRRVQGAAANTNKDGSPAVAGSSTSTNSKAGGVGPSTADSDPLSMILEAPIKVRKRRHESDSESDSDEYYYDGNERSKSASSPTSSSPSSSPSSSSILAKSVISTNPKSSSAPNSSSSSSVRATVAGDTPPPQPITRSPSGKNVVSSVKLDFRSASGASDSVSAGKGGSSLSSSSNLTSSASAPKKKFKRARKRNFDEEMEHRRRMNYVQDSDEEDSEEKAVLNTGYTFKPAKPSSSFRFAEKDQLLWFHLSLHRMSMMRQAPFWLTEPQRLAAERNRYKLANAACYPYGSPVEGSGSTSTTLNVMFHLADQQGIRVLLQSDAETSIQELKAKAYAHFETAVKSPVSNNGSGFVNILGTNALRIIDEYVVQLTDTPIFVLEEATTLKQLMVSASWMHVEQFTLVDRSAYELTKIKANKVSKMISINSSETNGFDGALGSSTGESLSTPAERITTTMSGLFGVSISTSTLSTPLYEPSDTEEMHFRKNVARNTVVLVKKTVQTASITIAPIPPYIPSRILTTIHFEPGSSSIIAAGPNSIVSELLEDAKKKFFVHASTAMVLKICGRREYVIQQNLPLHRIEYVRKQLERKRKIQFQLVKASSIGCAVNETTKSVKLPWEAEAETSAPSPASLEHPLSPRNFKPDSNARLTPGNETVNLRTQRSMSVNMPSQMISNSDASRIEMPRERAKRLRLAHRRASLYYPTTMAFAVPSWLIKQAFEVKICSADTLVFGESLKNLNVFQLSFFVEVGLFVGGEPIVKSETTSGLPWSDTLVWDQVLVFPSLCLGDIPKETRMCVTLYGHDKSGDIPLGWVSTRLFDFHDVLASGPMTTYMWPEEAANPIGFCGSCTKTKDKNSHRLKLEFESHALPVTYTDLMSLPRTQESSHPVPSEPQRLDIEDIAEMDPLFYPNNREREIIWRFRHHIKEHHPKALSKLCLSVPWTDPLQVQDFYKLLESWPKLEPENVLELLDARYANERVREYAVVCLEALTDSKLVSFMLQLVQVLKYEINHYTVLAQFLLDRALENEMVIGQRLFWYLKAELHVPEVRERFGLILEALLYLCSDQLREQLQQQITVIGILQDCALKVKAYPEARRTETIRRMLSDIKFPASFTLPLDPSQELSGNLDISKCRCFDSAKAPILLCFRSADPCIEKETDNLVIFKAGDDLRQDALTLQMLTLMDQMWKQAGLDLHMTPYQVAVTGDGTGLIEVVPDSMTTAKIQRENGGSLAAFSEKPLSNWLKANNPSENELFSAVDNFVLSCAGYCVATYVLGIGDRHNDNIMVDRKGHFFHIDFGHFLGNYKSWAGIWDREKAPFVFTPEFAFVMDGKDSDKFKYFVRQCQRAYNIVRQQGNFILNLFIMMLSTGIPELRSAADLLYLRDALASHLTDAEAGDFFIKLIDSSLGSTTTRLNAFFHLLAH